MGARLQGGVGEGMVGSHGLDTSTYKYVKNRIELVKVNKKDITLSIPVIVSCGGTPPYNDIAPSMSTLFFRMFLIIGCPQGQQV